MRRRHLLIPTLKETPSEAEVISHQLMLRAGLIRKVASGVYTWLPAGLRVLRKVEHIIHEEMQRIGAQELLMPIMQPATLWEESHRWAHYGPELMRFQDRHQRDFALGPTHEEVVTDLLRHEVKSYKQLPLSVYQIQTKFRDEVRPRFGLMRGREFLMKDAYSFHATPACLETTYQAMYDAYHAIFNRIGLRFRAVLADNGSIGGSSSHEFHVLAQSGEDAIAYCPNSDYAANIEKASAHAPSAAPQGQQPLTLVDTPDQRTIEAVCEYLDQPKHCSVKTLIVEGETTPLVALTLRGDHQLNPLKAEQRPEIKSPLTFADEKHIEEQLHCPIGFLGPVGLSIPHIVDRDAAALADFTCGANQVGKHYTGANWSRDAMADTVADLRNVEAGDPSPDGQGPLEIVRGIEVGHIFQLGDCYTHPMNATVLNEQGQQQTLLMGCYGIGVSRVVAATIEQHHDERGIIWPESIAPFQVVLIGINASKSEDVNRMCERLYTQLTDAGIDVLLDDRAERPGVMFSDADLLGVPHRLVVGEKNLKNGHIEYKERTGDEAEYLNIEEVTSTLLKKIGTVHSRT